MHLKAIAPSVVKEILKDFNAKYKADDLRCGRIAPPEMQGLSREGGIPESLP